MEKKRLLLVIQDLDPYTVASKIAEITMGLPKYMHDNGLELRILMPRFGTVNERRHRLHEVVRLSGMNIVVNDEDFPLIIKVASMPGSRLQVYFLDNDEFFKRKQLFTEEDGTPFEDNLERMIFFCKGAIETVKKFGWPPDIIHCHGWMTSFLPFYLRTLYKDEPIFRNAQITWSIYEQPEVGNITPEDLEKSLVLPMKKAVLDPFISNGKVDFNLGSTIYADAIVQCVEELPAEIAAVLESGSKPMLDYLEGESLLPAYHEFYENLLSQEV
jgi:starch synthase